MIALSKCESKFDYYLKWLESVNAEVIVLDKSRNNENELYKCDSLILTGGADVHPEISGLSAEDDQVYHKDRDIFELKILDISLKEKIPTLCICRGMQLINIVMKGTLVQDIEKRYMNICHKKLDNRSDRMHNIIIKEDSLLYNLTGITSGEVNSSHHQCIDKPADEFEITSFADEVIPESMEWKNKEGKYPLLCIQWHPERMVEKDSPFSKNILQWIIKQKKEL